MENCTPNKHSRHIAVCVTNSRKDYSGGRYHGLMLANALAFGGNKVVYITNILPAFWQDIASFESQEKLTVVITLDFKTKMPSGMDYVFIVPGTSESSFYFNTLDFALKNNAHICLLNFESGNWFNLYSPVKRDPGFWENWKTVASVSSLVLSSTEEAVKYARKFYLRTPQQTEFAFCYPAINTACADSIGPFERENRILLLARFFNAEHKGTEMIADLISSDMASYVLTILVGTGKIPADLRTKLKRKCSSCGVKLDIRFKASDNQKFELYKKSKLLLFPSLFEGFGYPPIEARYCGCNVVAFDLPVLRETNGDDVFYARYGDWQDFKSKIKKAMLSASEPTRYRLEKIACLPSMANKLNEILQDLDAKIPDHSRWAAKRRPKWISNLYRFWAKLGEKYVFLLCRKFRKKINTEGIITFYPPFREASELSSHFFRATWYLPYCREKIQKVYLYAKKDAKLRCPDCMSRPESLPTHISLLSFSLSYTVKLISSKVVLRWSSNNYSSFWLKLFEFLGIIVVNVDTHDLESKEYGAYPGIIWRYLVPQSEKDKVINDSHQKLITIFEKEKKHGKSAAVVFGTGPSLEKAYNYNFEKCFTIVCNTIIQNKNLMDHIKPSFVTAGDAVSHYGVSKYAARFREDLVKALESNPDLYYLGTATFGLILYFHFPHLKEQILLIEQNEDYPNYDLIASYSAPKLDSTMNIHMLPLAATFHDDIYILGCDGKGDKSENEDFWPHASDAQYHDLVTSGHLCHPTFDQHRQISTYSRHLDSVKQTLEIGERKYGKRYTSLNVSNIPAFRDRQLTNAWYRKNSLVSPPISIAKIQTRINLHERRGHIHSE